MSLLFAIFRERFLGGIVNFWEMDFLVGGLDRNRVKFLCTTMYCNLILSRTSDLLK